MGEASMLVKGGLITGMLTFGTFTVVLQKVIFNMEGKGRHGDHHKFEKPWFQTEAMFIGMLGCLVVYELMEIWRKYRAANDPASQSLLGVGQSDVQTTAPPYDEVATPDSNGMAITPKKTPSKLKQYLLVIIPALCDMTATAMMNIGLLWISPSVWQMLRGSMTIFSAIFSKFFLKRELHASHWIGVCVVAFALAVVAFSALMPDESKDESSSSSAEHVSTAKQIIGCTLVVVAQIIQASQIVVEEFLLAEVSLHPVLIVGLEGLWGSISCALLLVVVYFIPTPYGEDGIDTLYMLFHNGKILGVGIAYMAVILCYNLFGMFVTKVTSAVIRTILEGLRCACIWVVNLFIHYVVTNNPNFGEAWTNWSYLQLCGFLFLLLGMFVYNGIIRIEGLYYAPKKT